MKTHLIFICLSMFILGTACDDGPTYSIKGKISVKDNCGNSGDNEKPDRIKEEVEITYELLQPDGTKTRKTARVKLNKELEAEYSISVVTTKKLDKESRWSVPEVVISCPKDRCNKDSIPNCGLSLIGKIAQIPVEKNISVANLTYECRCLP